jgi:membrane protease YdiL (CAAX protease family)
MAEQRYDEKEAEKREEKYDEKEVAKQEEKWEEKWHRDPLSTIVGAAILIWAGVAFLAGNLGLLDAFTRLLDGLRIRAYEELPFEIPFIHLEALSVFFLGAGLIVLVEVIIRLLMPTYRKNVVGSIIGAAVFFALGTGNWNLIWPLILIAVGASILLGGFARRR